MRIKRIDLCGFKSFCDPTKIDLSQDLTAVVGPNGCGKSNVVDALRWAMGEQSARHLRGKSMDDVIFSGSDSRGPAGFAEVSVTFENDGRAPAEYLDYAEITVTRRLHRDGTSEYLINKMPVRLRDITNLFLGTGVGTKAYSIIEQGRIGLIVSAKPTERRHFIEEAAGITKYHRRRHLAERKMEATRQNLLRVTDVLEEIEKRLGSLRRQAQKAERYKRYRTEMRDIELWAASHKMLGLAADDKVITGTLSKLEEDRVTAQVELEKQELELEQLRVALLEQEQALTDLQEELYQTDNRIQLNQNQIAYQLKEADELSQRAEASRGEIAGLDKSLAEANAQRDELSARAADLDNLRRGLADRLAEQQGILASYSDELQGVEAAIEHEREALASAEREQSRAHAETRALVQKREAVQERLDAGRTESSELVTRIAEYKSLAHSLDEELELLHSGMAELTQRKGDAVSELASLREKAARDEQEVEVLRTELHRRRSRLASLEEIQARYEGFGKGTRAILQRYNGSSRERGILGVVADMVDAPAQYEAALESVLGQRLGAVIVESSDVGMESIRYLKEHSHGRSSFIACELNPRNNTPSLANAPVGYTWSGSAGSSSAGSSAGSDVQTLASQPEPVFAAEAADAPWAGDTPTEPAVETDQAEPAEQSQGVHGPMLSLVGFQDEYADVAAALLGDVLVVENIEKAITLWGKVEQNTLVTLDGEILDADGTVTGGSRDVEASGILQQKREIKEISDIAEDLQLQFDAKMQQHVQCKTEIARLERIVEQTTHDGHDSDKQILTREKDVNQLREQLQHAEARQSELGTSLEQWSVELSKITALHQQEEACVDQARIAQRTSKDASALLWEEHARLKEIVRGAARSAADARVANAEADANYQAVAQQLSQLEEVCADRVERRQRLADDAEKGVARAESLRSEVEYLRVELENSVTARANLQEKLSEERKRYDDRKLHVVDQDNQLKATRTRVGEFLSEINALQLRQSELKMAREHLAEQVWDRYRERLASVVGEFHLRPPVTDQQLKRLEEVRKLIERMGGINLTAIDEFNELNERFEFLSTQKADLESALGQLSRAIQKINRTCRKRFLETFELVNAQFQKVFPRLFRGGRAKLMLSDAEDVLEGGVEIVAQPPGKKLVSIEIMSGGEKALTATSLIFAMFLVKPTPFCLLDEVDAPLDEANVIRLRELISEMSESSQFILITHNRNTMEIAERLYGVTMEEPGISKIVGVNLREAQAVAA